MRSARRAGVSGGSVEQKCVDESSPEGSLERGERFGGDSGRAIVIVRPVTEKMWGRPRFLDERVRCLIARITGSVSLGASENSRGNTLLE